MVGVGENTGAVSWLATRALISPGPTGVPRPVWVFADALVLVLPMSGQTLSQLQVPKPPQPSKPPPVQGLVMDVAVTA